MNEYPNLMKYLPFNRRRQVATKICQVNLKILIEKKIKTYYYLKAVSNLRQPLSDLGVTKQLLTFIAPLLKTEKDYQENEPYEFEEEQQLVARLVHLVTGGSLAQIAEILDLFRGRFLEGESKRMKFTIPSIIFAYINLIHNITLKKDDSLPLGSLLKLTKGLIDKIASPYPEVSLRLYLNLLLCINEFDHSKEVNKIILFNK
jgi:vacuolar protein sorting-associated protein 35